MVKSIEFTRANWHDARSLGAPCERLLDHAPLWVGRSLDVPDGLHVAHASPSCAWLILAGYSPKGPQVADVTAVRVDSHMRFLREPGSTALAMCNWCTVSSTGLRLHPLRRLISVLRTIRNVRSALTDDSEPTSCIESGEQWLAGLGRLTNAAKRDLLPEQELGFWAEWLDGMYAEAAALVDGVRGKLAHQWNVGPAEPGVFVRVAYNLTPTLMLHRERVVALACPVVARHSDQRFVVRVPPDGLPRVDKGFTVLGPERPMTPESWALFERLLDWYREPDAYKAAADSVGRLDQDAALALELLLDADVPAEALINTVLAVTR